MKKRAQRYRPSSKPTGRPRVSRSGYLYLNLRNKHSIDAVKAEAKVRGMSVCSFMRSMIKGYFAAALHGR